MIDNIWFVAAIWMGVAFPASLISIRFGISVALVEIRIGVLGGNFLEFTRQPNRRHSGLRGNLLGHTRIRPVKTLIAAS